MRDRLRIVRSLCDAVAVGAALWLIAGKFPTDVMFANTVTNGGDMGTHYYAAEYMRDWLLPHGAVTGWCPGNYCGFPLFQFYFFLPFVLIALLSHAIPLTIAFKIGTVLGTFALPLCAYGAARLGALPFPAPALAALATLPFLFMEANSMWGGNIPSTLAGEFAFSLGLALAILFLGVLRRVIDRRRGYAWAGLMVAIIGMTHGYTLLWAGLFSAYELVVTEGWWRRVGALVAIHGLAILIMAFWLFPLLAYAPWTTSYSHVWIIKDWKEIMPPILWIPAGIAVGTLLVHVALALLRIRPFSRMLGLTWWATSIGIIFYFCAKAFHVVDIRFFPFLQLGLCLCAAMGLGLLLAELPAPEIWPLVGALVIPQVVGTQVTFIPSWVKWNYSGFERKGTWGTLKGIIDKLKGGVGDPRVVYEHSPDHEALGTIRVFENLPFFTGRSTLEGLYMQGSPSAPFVFYVQSEVSNVMSCPFPDWGCSRPNVPRGVEHLKMMNVSHYIVKSKPIKEAVAKHPGLALESTIGDYQIWRVKENLGRYAIPVTTKPVLVHTDTWKELSYMWFKTATPESVLPVFTTKVEPDDEKLFARVSDGMPAEFPREPLAAPPVLQETMENDRITITGCKPGYPILVRISYHPRWHALTGEKVWLAGPTFMLVFPKGDRVELAFGGSPVVTVGRVCTAIGWLLFLLAVLPTRRALVAARERLAEIPGVPALVDWMRAWPVGVRRGLLAAGLLVAAAIFTSAGVAARGLDADGSYNYGMKLYTAQNLNGAIPYFQQAQRLSPLSNTAIHSTYFEGISYFRQDQWAKALETFERLVTRFPEGPSSPEGLYHIGLCKARLGDMPGAIAAWQDTQKRYPDTPWAKYAGERLAEQQKIDEQKKMAEHQKK
jgi:hypothetical protein